MSIRRRLFLLITAILLLSSVFLSRQLLNSFRRGYSDVVESLMFEFATALAAQVEVQGGLDLSRNRLDAIFRTYRERSQASLANTSGGFAIYVTDEKGVVVYSSHAPEEVGRDYSRWRDVYLTLRNTYGARSTRTDPKDPRSSVYFVAAPIRMEGRIRGVVSVIKSEQSVSPFLSRAFDQVLPYAVLGLLLVGLFTILVMTWVVRPVHLLRDYALGVSEGKSVSPPAVKPRELRELLAAFEKMRITLEGRKEIERFVQGLVHELKSPLTAIRGAAELALEPIDADRRERFLRSILTENLRLQRLLDELLRIARLETRYEPSEAMPVVVSEILFRIRSAFEALADSRRVELRISGDTGAKIEGEAELIESALRCLVLNAFDFAPMGSVVEIIVRQNPEGVVISVRDEGPGVPEYAVEKIFERFFSLERPNKTEKSTGLGLNFVGEVMKLHQGSVRLDSAGPGAVFSLRFPRLNRHITVHPRFR